MTPLNPDFDLERFFLRLAGARERVLLLDYDGTIAPFHVDPRLALPYPRVCEGLRRVIASGTRVVIVSGRRIEDLRAPLALLPHREVWASHGWERLVDGRLERLAPPQGVLEGLAHARSLARGLAALGVRIEAKIASVALHWRGLPGPAAARARSEIARLWSPLATQDLALLPFDGGLEIRARARDKGHAVREALAGREDAVSAYLGDDLTDEDAFRAIRPHGMAVLVREKPRATLADVWLSQPWQVTAFLDRWSRH